MAVSLIPLRSERRAQQAHLRGNQLLGGLMEVMELAGKMGSRAGMIQLAGMGALGGQSLGQPLEQEGLKVATVALEGILQGQVGQVGQEVALVGAQEGVAEMAGAAVIGIIIQDAPERQAQTDQQVKL